MESTLEIWRPVLGYEGIYSASSLGRVRSEPRLAQRSSGKTYAVRGRVLKPYVMKSGYHIYDLRKNNEAFNHYAHRIVLEAFVGPAEPGHQGCHNNGNRGDNRLENLRWDTSRANHADKVAHGTQYRGESHPSSKITEAAARKIRQDQRSSQLIAEEHGITFGTVCAIRRGDHWKHL